MKTAFKEIYILLTLMLVMSCSSTTSTTVKEDTPPKLIVAYVTSGSSIMPDPTYMTHINYAFGHVNESFNGVTIDNPDRLMQIIALKKLKPSLKVMLSIGGWGSGRFSEMAATTQNRKQFAEGCRQIVKEFNLDGIDLDWEYPTSSAANISSSPNDTNNFTLLMKEIRSAIGKDKLLTLASAASAQYIDFKSIDPYVNFVNIMAYDMATAPKHLSALYPSEHSGRLTSDEAVKRHLAAGFPRHKLVLGMPFYGRGDKNKTPDFMDYKDIVKQKEFATLWDEKGMVPYLADSDGKLVCGFENPRSLTIKCQYIKDQELLGAMYWEYNCDNEGGDLRKAVYETIMD